MNYNDVNTFYNSLLCDIEDDIVVDCEDELKAVKKMILIKTVMNGRFEEVIEYIHNQYPQIEIFVISDCKDEYLLELGIEKDHAISHKGKFSKNQAYVYSDCIRLINPDAICYINYAIYKDSYANVMGFVSNILNFSSRSQVFLFSLLDKKFVKHKNIHRFHCGLSMVRGLANYRDIFDE